MTKRDITRKIAEESGLTLSQARQIVQRTFNAIITALVEDGRVELRNVGVFEVRQRKARNARNPRTGEKVFVPEQSTVIFKPGRLLEARVADEYQRHESAR